MKIKSDAVDLRGLSSQSLQQQKQNEGSERAEEVRRNRPDDAGSVKLGIGREIQNLQEARRQRIEELKELVKRGEYRPDSEKVAKSIANAVSEEIFFEGLLSGGSE